MSATTIQSDDEWEYVVEMKSGSQPSAPLARLATVDLARWYIASHAASRGHDQLAVTVSESPPEGPWVFNAGLDAYVVHRELRRQPPSSTSEPAL